VALGSLALQSSVYADNSTTYNGSYCSSYFGSQYSDFGRGFNGIANYANAPRYISCPMIEQEVNVTKGILPTLLYYTGDGTVTCALYSNNADGSTRQTQMSSRTGTGWLTIPGITTDDYYGSYSMYCLLPAKGTLNTIFFDEHDKNS
jgi:hypothetical protein